MTRRALRRVIHRQHETEQQNERLIRDQYDHLVEVEAERDELRRELDSLRSSGGHSIEVRR